MKQLGNWPDWRVKWIILIFVTLFICFIGIKKSRADEPQFTAAIGAAALRGETPAVTVGLVYPDAGPGDADYELSLSMVGESEFHARHQSNQAAVKAMLIDGYGPVDLGLGVVALQNVDEYNGSRMNFSLLLRYNITRRVFVEYNHWSNAGTVKPNLGRDMLLIGVRL